jgi:hypothetical protein
MVIVLTIGSYKYFFNLANNYITNMKPNYTLKALFAALSLPALIIFSGCGKEPGSNPKVTSTTNTTAVDTSYYMNGTFDGRPLKIVGNNVSYARIDTTITTDHPGGGCDGGQWGQDPDNDDQKPVYVTGTQWLNVSSAGVQSSHSSIELRTLDVRVFVAPIAVQHQNQFYSILKSQAYPLATPRDPQEGAYVSILDDLGVRWTSIGDQTGSTFQITSVGANISGVLYTTFSGTFSINVYDGNGRVKQLSNVTFTALAGL